MTLNYKGKEFEITELKEPNENTSFDVIAIFEVQGLKYNFVNYFYGADDSKENIINNSKIYIDRYLKENE